MKKVEQPWVLFVMRPVSPMLLFIKHACTTVQWYYLFWIECSFFDSILFCMNSDGCGETAQMHMALVISGNMH